MSEKTDAFWDKITIFAMDILADVSDCVEDNPRGALVISGAAFAVGLVVGLIL